MKKLVHMFGNIIATGSEAELVKILDAFEKYGIDKSKFEIV